MQKNLKIIPLGGLGEIGRNMMLLEYGEAILIIDMGLGFPDEDMPGIDFTIPNISYLKGKEKNISAIVITHGHYDHVGAIPYLAGQIGNPIIYASPLTQAIITRRQDDFPSQPKLKIQQVKDGSRIKTGPFSVEFFRMNHNIPDNLGLFIETPVGNILHTSDFKFDPNPMNELPTDFQKLRELSKRKVLLLASDSTSAEEKGHSLSEKEISENLEEIFSQASGRIIVATFSSLLNRIQQIILLSEKHGRRVIIDGYSMKTNVETSRALGYIKMKKETLIQAKDVNNWPDSKITVLCTGAQAEDNAILMKITNGEHRFIRFKKKDTVVFSSSVIPGNERTIQRLKDNVLRQGTKVFHYKMMDIHAGGHAYQNELKEMLQIINPKFFMPIHGQYSMLVSHANLAQQAIGLSEKDIIVADNGQIINLSQNKIFIEKEVVPSNYVMVDGLGVGDIGEVVLRDRNMLSKDGMFVIIVIIDRQSGRVKGSPDIISRGFVYLRESKELLKSTRKKIVDLINHATAKPHQAVNLIYLKDEVRDKIGQFLYTKTKRRPMILPVIIEV